MPNPESTEIRQISSLVEVGLALGLVCLWLEMI